MRIESNLDTTVMRIVNVISDKTHTEKALREAALNALALVPNRVQQYGQGTEGPLRTKSKRTFGAYSWPYGKIREMRGFQTSHIDWTVDGDLWRSWQVLKSDSVEALIGFDDSEMAKRAGYVEELNGKALGLTEEEKEVVFDTFKETLLSSMNL